LPTQSIPREGQSGVAPSGLHTQEAQRKVEIAECFPQRWSCDYSWYTQPPPYPGGIRE